MKYAIIGSRGLIVNDLGKYLPSDATEIVSGGAAGIDTCARTYALEHNLQLTEFMPDYRRFGRGAPLKRNLQIIEYADAVLAFWDGKSHGTKFVIDRCNRLDKPLAVILLCEEGTQEDARGSTRGAAPDPGQGNFGKVP